MSTGEFRVRYKPALRRCDEQGAKKSWDSRWRGESRSSSATRWRSRSGARSRAGFLISGFYEDRHRDDPIAAFMPTFVATRAIKP